MNTAHEYHSRCPLQTSLLPIRYSPQPYVALIIGTTQVTMTHRIGSVGNSHKRAGFVSSMFPFVPRLWIFQVLEGVFLLRLLNLVTFDRAKYICLYDGSHRRAICILILQRLQANFKHAPGSTSHIAVNCTIEIHRLVVLLKIQNAPRTNHKTNEIGSWIRNVITTTERCEMFPVQFVGVCWHLPQHCRGSECPSRERKGSLVCRWRKDSRGPAPVPSAAMSAWPPSGTLGTHRRPCSYPSFLPVCLGTPLPTYREQKGKFLWRKLDTCPRCLSSPVASWSKGNHRRWRRDISFAARSW